ncbi:helix-turn-helix domain-containing protein [Aliibacillus thermotolerans]|nr:helix-turn-helix domain-containing protein [Aliibacillus thermotolerans]
MDYFIQVRIEKATELIKTTDLFISDIAEQVGYQDPYYFSRLYKKYTGISPSAVRRQWKQDKRDGFEHS